MAHMAGEFARWVKVQAFPVEAQTALSVSAIVSTQLDAVAPVSKYIAQMYNLLVVK